MLLYPFEASTIRVLRSSFGKETSLLIIDATLTDGLEPLLMLAHVLDRYSGVIDEIYAPYALFSSISGDAGGIRRKFTVLINLLRFLEDEMTSHVMAFTSYRMGKEWLEDLFDDVTVVGGDAWARR